MKRLFSLLALWAVLLSCDTYEDFGTLDEPSRDSLNVEANLNVSMADVLKVVRQGGLGVRTKSTNPDVTPIVFENDTLLYVANLNPGWQVISGDKRTPIILAYSEEGSFDQEANPYQAVWLDQMARDISNVKRSDDENLNPEYVRLWSVVDGTNETDLAPLEEGGHWELIKRNPLPNQETTGPHLIQTTWGQSAPWNERVPYADNSSEKCLAGCVAISGAQMMYFLHNKLGVPAEMYSTGGYVGNADTNPAFGNLSSDIWSRMGLNTSASASAKSNSAILIAYMEHAVDMNYGLDGSNSDTKKLVDVFSDWGISSRYTDFDATLAYSSIRKGMPVIVRANGDRTNLFLGILYKYEDGHSWIIDGYKTVKVSTERTFEWVSDDLDSYERDPDGNIIGGSGIFKTDVISTTSEYFRMNWGWGGAFNNDFYLLGGDWLVPGDEGDPSNFIYSRSMIIDFAKK